jgi:nicotinamide riboside kinase
MDPGSTGNLQRWWTETHKRVRRIDRKRFDSMVICTAWTLWKQQNARAFGDTRRQKDVDQMLQEIRDEFHLWVRAKRVRSLDVARE